MVGLYKILTGKEVRFGNQQVSIQWFYVILFLVLIIEFKALDSILPKALVLSFFSMT